MTWIHAYTGIEGGGEVQLVVTGAELRGQVTICPSLLGQVAMRDFISIDEDNSVTVDRLQRDDNRGVFVNDATVVLSLKDENENEFGSTQLSYVSGSKGKYQGVIPKSFTAGLVEGDIYFVDLTLTDPDPGGNRDGFRRISKPARFHGETP